MHLKSLGLLCFLAAMAAVAAAEQGKEKVSKANEPQAAGANLGKDGPLLKSDATAKDLKDFPCAKLTAQQLNALSDPKACTVLTASCLKDFDVTDVKPACLGQVPLDQWKKFDKTTAEQISNAPVATLELTPAQFSAILPKLPLDKLSASLSGFVARNNALLEVVFGTHEAKYIAAFMTPANLAAVDPSQFHRFSDSFIGALDEKALSQISAVQLGLIAPEGMKGLSPAKFASLSVAALAGLTNEQAKRVPKACWASLTPEQIRGIGSSPTAIEAAAKSQKQHERILTERQYKENHPCATIGELLKTGDLREPQLKAYTEHCKQVQALKLNGSAAVVATAAGTVVAILVAAAVPIVL